MNRETKPYESPRIEDHGDLTELTALQGASGDLDATFPAGTPFDDLTGTGPTTP